MAEAETALQMAARHVAEQEARVSEQEEAAQGPSDRSAEGMLAEICAICRTICATT
jgi:hypothetical protein